MLKNGADKKAKNNDGKIPVELLKLKNEQKKKEIEDLFGNDGDGYKFNKKAALFGLLAIAAATPIIAWQVYKKHMKKFAKTKAKWHPLHLLSWTRMIRNYCSKA